jgi:hypothetical protein
LTIAIFLVQAFLSIAQCVAALTIQCQQFAGNVVNQFVADIKVKDSY